MCVAGSRRLPLPSGSFCNVSSHERSRSSEFGDSKDLGVHRRLVLGQNSQRVAAVSKPERLHPTVDMGTQRVQVSRSLLLLMTSSGFFFFMSCPRCGVLFRFFFPSFPSQIHHQCLSPHLHSLFFFLSLNLRDLSRVHVRTYVRYSGTLQWY